MQARVSMLACGEIRRRSRLERRGGRTRRSRRGRTVRLPRPRRAEAFQPVPELPAPAPGVESDAQLRRAWGGGRCGSLGPAGHGRRPRGDAEPESSGSYRAFGGRLQGCPRRVWHFIAGSPSGAGDAEPRARTARPHPNAVAAVWGQTRSRRGSRGGPPMDEDERAVPAGRPLLPRGTDAWLDEPRARGRHPRRLPRRTPRPGPGRRRGPRWRWPRRASGPASPAVRAGTGERTGPGRDEGRPPPRVTWVRVP